MMASNSSWVAPLGPDDRRFAVFDVLPDHKDDLPYFKRIADQLEAGGHAAMLHELLSHDLTGFEVRNIPNTAARTDQKKHGLRGTPAWLYDELWEGGDAWRDNGMRLVDKSQGYERFVQSSHRRGDPRPASLARWCQELKEVLGWAINLEHRERLDDGRTGNRQLRFASLDECRARFALHLGDTTMAWPTD
jgi:hypothetical protein